jgi:repressor LexA
MKGLTKKQAEILDYINANVKLVIPTFRDIAGNFGMTVKGAYDHVKAIEKKGYIDKRFTRIRRTNGKVKP